MAQEEPPPGDPFVTGDEIGEQIDGSDWTPCTEASSGRVYYYNFGSEESVWELPAEEPDADASALSVECPEGCGAGDLLNIEVEGIVVQVEVPEGIAAGDVFEVYLSHGDVDDDEDAEDAEEGVGVEDEQDEEPTAPRSFVLLVLPNAYLPAQKKLRVEASTLDELCETVGAAVGVADAVVCAPSDSASDESVYTSLDEIGDKEKVMAWPAAAFVDELAVDIAEPPEERDFILMVQANEHVPTSRKLKLSASTLEELSVQIGEALRLRSDLTVTRPTGSPGEADCFSSLGELESKAKVMVWPASKLRYLRATATVDQQRKAEAAEAQAQADAAAEAQALAQAEAEAETAAAAAAAAAEVEAAAEAAAATSAMPMSDEPPGDPFAADDEIGESIEGTKWAECTQASTGRVYYFNFDTEESTWNVPGLESEGDRLLERKAEADTELEPEPEQSDHQHEDADEDGEVGQSDNRQVQEDQEEEEGERDEDEEDEDDGGLDNASHEPGREAREALARHSKNASSSLGTPPQGRGPTPRRHRRSADHTPRSSSHHDGSGTVGSAGRSSSSRRRRRRRRSQSSSSRKGGRDDSGTPATALKPSTPKSSPRSPAIIVRGPAFDPSCHPLQGPPTYDPTRDKYMPPEYRKRISDKRKEIQRAQALEHEMAVRQRYERLGGYAYDDDDYSGDEYYSDDDYSGSSSDFSEDEDEEDDEGDQEEEEDEDEAKNEGGSGSAPSARRRADTADKAATDRASPAASSRRIRGHEARGQPSPIDGSIALQHSVGVRPSDCDRFGELSAGSGVQFCADAMEVWSLKSTNNAASSTSSSWRAVVRSSDTHWVRRVRAGEEIVMTVEIRAWLRDGSFDVSFEARVAGEEVFTTECRFEGLAPAKNGIGWGPAPPPKAFRRLWIG